MNKSYKQQKMYQLTMSEPTICALIYLATECLLTVEREEMRHDYVTPIQLETMRKAVHVARRQLRQQMIDDEKLGAW